MSNQVMLIPCKFVDTPSGDVSFGFRMVDDYGKTYSNNLDRELPDDDLEALEEVLTNHMDETITGFLEYLSENECGITIRDVPYEWNEIKEIVNKFV